MKKLFTLCVCVCFSASIFTSCNLFNKKEDIDETLLPGKWQEGTLFERYYSNGEGSTWDTADDVTEAEAQPFTWTLVEDDLTQIHIMEMGGNVPKYYTVTVLSATKLSYHDDYGVTHTFTRVD